MQRGSGFDNEPFSAGLTSEMEVKQAERVEPDKGTDEDWMASAIKLEHALRLLERKGRVGFSLPRSP